MTVSVIVPNWNGAAWLGPLFASLNGQRSLGEVLLVDNGSTDHSSQLARAAGARVIELGRNLGFAAAVNQGVREARCPWLAILNNDVELAPDWVAALLDAATAESAWFATGKLLDSIHRDTIDGTFDAVCRGATAWRCGAGRLDSPAFSQRVRIQMASFSAILIRKAAFDRVGPLDEQFESYLEDVDFGIRCAGAGLSGVYVPKAIGFHQGSATLGRWHPDTVRRIARNQVYLVAKHYPEGWARRYLWAVLVAQGMWGLLALRHGAAGSWMAGKLEGVRRFREVRRRAIRSGDLSSILDVCERQIRDLQRQTGSDLYWKLYFALT